MIWRLFHLVGLVAGSFAMAAAVVIVGLYLLDAVDRLAGRIHADPERRGLDALRDIWGRP